MLRCVADWIMPVGNDLYVGCLQAYLPLRRCAGSIQLSARLQHSDLREHLRRHAWLCIIDLVCQNP